MEKFYTMTPAIITLAILSATMWYPYYRWRKNVGEPFNSIAWRKLHVKRIFLHEWIKMLLFTVPWQTLVFFAPLIFAFDHLTLSAWIACAISGVMFMLFGHGSLLWTDSKAKLSDDDIGIGGLLTKEPETDNLLHELKRIARKYPRKMFRRKIENIFFALIQGTALAAVAILMQSVWKIFLLQVLLIPTIIIATITLSLLMIIMIAVYEIIEDRFIKR